MKTETRHALKQDKFAQAAQGGVSWVTDHRSGVLRWVITGAAVIIVIVAALVFWNVRSSSAQAALGAALDTYSAPLNQPGAPAQAGSYNTAAERSKAANQQFVAVANQYGMMPEGSKAHYFAGVTYQELGQTGSAESELKQAAGSWNRDIANLAKLALAGLYHQTGRDAQAIDIYNELIKSPSTTVSASVAQLDLADLYIAQGKQDQARKLWASIKDSDKDGMAGSLAAQKLAGKQQ
ncbi:tetratricopeptide repeat protein [Occallatibacter riparius]|uniref:Tetratricopeptide repeat protein n=1 Tax=Occallatibacter riparius TaxID=1002689 RepID=A0A9J7BTF1_9BACT|nr:tetratricopeptide repeat protein [Occallatibacter riparius]UWZ84182.1 tetratricopeptide repeat protein [Occallatibacter riparius]